MKRSRAVRGTERERVGLYKRVSLDRAAHGLQDEILSPETQEDRGRAYCQAQDWLVATVAEDIDESGYRQHYSHRPGLMRLIDAVERGELTKIVVYKFSRLSRRLKEFIELCDRIEAAGAGLVSVTEQIDTSTPAGRLIRNILASFAQFQSEEISEHIFETWLTKAKRGERPGGLAPFGTRNNKGVLEPDPVTYPALLAIFQTFRATGSIRAVWDSLTAHGVPAPRAQTSKTRAWNLNTIRGILTNPVYMGRLEWAGEVFQARWEPLLPQALWHEVQSRLRARKTAPLGRRGVHMLTGFLICGGCGRPMWTRYAKRSSAGSSHLRRVYWCCSPSTQRRGCEVPALDGEELEAVVWQTVVTLILAAGVQGLVITAAKKRLDRSGDDRQRRRQQSLAEKQRIEREASLLVGLLEDGSISREQFRQQNRHLLGRLQALESELAGARAVPRGPDIAVIERAAAASASALNNDERRQILSALDARVLATPARVEVTVAGMRINLRGRLVGQTWHFGARYHRLDFPGSLLTDKQIRFVRRTYDRADRKQIALRLRRSYPALIQLARRLRRDGVLATMTESARR